MSMTAETSAFFFAPFVSSPMRIDPQWIDYNGHLNMAYYNVLADRALDEVFAVLGLGPDYAQSRRASTFTAEAHVVYKRELTVGDPVRATVQLVDYDDKRLHLFVELRHAREAWLSATVESMNLHVGLTDRKVTPFPPEILANIAVLRAPMPACPGPSSSPGSSACRPAPAPASPGCTDADARAGAQARLAMLRPASAKDLIPNRMKVTPTTRVTMRPCLRKKRRTAGRPAQNRMTT